MPKHPHADFPRAGFLRRLGAFIYDALLVAAIYMVAGAVAMLFTVILEKLGLISLEGYQDMAEYLGVQPWFSFYLAVCICSFFCWFWVRSGQTLGMRAWRLKVQNEDGTPITFTQALIRLFTAAMGLGNLLVIFDRRQKRAFQDYMADCVVVVLSKEANQLKNWQGV
ncbi:RDD family protein [Corallincola platygyrae]|uniref:RDD family protein n=1 Tax=Corallincola platygyrae TaxID=1193278 RepID=A0ABW4XN21_9GAMM